ncbi:MAG: NfeD family protein [Candidatus Villigracilaceae bacterium]
MNILLDPNVSYVLLVLGIFLAALALISPGTGMLEVGALFLTALAAYGAYNLGVNIWSLIVILLAVLLYFYAIRAKRPGLVLGLSILGLIGGSAFLFTDGWKPLVNPFLAGIISVLSAGSMWLMITKALEAHRVQPRHSLEALIGQIGEAKTSIHEEGSVQVAGELWSARSLKPIRAGSRVRVLERDGFVLLVTSDEKTSEK